jgi:hypothetical protein
LLILKTPFSKSSASLPRVTAADHRFVLFTFISMTFEKLNLPFVPLRGDHRTERAKIASFSGRLI